MTKKTLENKTDHVVEQTNQALQTVYDALNQGQKKKVIKNEAVKELFDRFNVNYE